MSCQERSGFLFAHACDRPEAWNCAACGKPICAEHTRLTEAGNVCISCLQAQQTQQTADQQAGHDPYFYGGQRTAWDVDDYAAFDDDTTASAADSGSDLGGS